MVERDTSRLRLTIVGIVCVSLFASLLTRLWYLQGVAADDYRVTADSVYLRTIHEEGPRGRILDRNGRVLVDNRVSLVLGLDRQVLGEVDDERRGEVFTELADTLTSFGLPTKATVIEERYQDPRWGPLEFVPVVPDLPSQDVELYVAEHSDRFPGVVVKRRAVRTYPYGSLAAHLVGYVGQINEEELESAEREEGEIDASQPREEGAKPYQGGDEIGKAGVEATFERDLRGIPADRRIQVDARGDYVGTLDDEEAQPGDDIWLTIDIDLQAHAEQLLRQQLDAVRGSRTSDGKVRRAPQGSVVITNPQNGEILAMASYPSYDPAELVNGIDSDLWARLNDEGAGQPLFNWALQGTYAPGSTFKLFTAVAAKESGYLGPGNDVIVDRGSYEVGNCEGESCRFRNAGSVAYGSVDLPRSLTVSSDVYYYRIADELWQRRGVFGETPIQDWAARFGVGARTGVALPGEGRGRLPTPELLRRQHEENPDVFPRGEWYAGDNLNTSIGQGDVLMTPLQLVNSYATFANGGTRMTPLIVRKVTRPRDLGRDPADPENHDVIREADPLAVNEVGLQPRNALPIAAGIQGAVMSGEGTANDAFDQSPTAWPMAGKTGTAEVAGKADTALFVAYGPVLAGTDPTWAISVVLPEAGFGGEQAAPLAFRIMKPVSEATVPPVTPIRPTPATSGAAP